MSEEKFKVLVKTGNQLWSGTNSNIRLVIEDAYGIKTKATKLDNVFRDDFERGRLDTFSVKFPVTFGPVGKIYVSRDQTSFDDQWFCEYFIIQDPRGLSSTSKSHRKIKNVNCPGTIHDAHNHRPQCARRQSRLDQEPRLRCWWRRKEPRNAVYRSAGFWFERGSDCGHFRVRPNQSGQPRGTEPVFRTSYRGGSELDGSNWGRAGLMHFNLRRHP